jgi:hypothetical protein
MHGEAWRLRFDNVSYDFEIVTIENLGRILGFLLLVAATLAANSFT